MSTLPVVEEILRDARRPMVVKEIVRVAGDRLPTKSKTPDTVVARDLAMDIKKKGEQSRFARVAPGQYTLREYVPMIREQMEREARERAKSVEAEREAEERMAHEERPAGHP